MLAVFLIALFGVLLGAFYFLDRLLRHEYHFHRDALETDGRPAGYLFHPPEASWFRSGLAFQRCAFRWLFSTPNWTRNDQIARTLLSRLRWCVLVWNIGILILVVTVMTQWA